MIKGYKKLSIFVCLLMLLSCIAVFGASPRVYDDAALFSEAELQSLEARATELSEGLQMDLVIVTITDNLGKTSRQFADDFYDENGFGYGSEADGVLLLINMEDREVYITTTGIAIKYLTDARIEAILDKVYEYLPDGHYGDAAMAFLTQVDNYVRTGIPSDQYTYDEDTNTIVEEETPLVQKLFYYFIIAIAAAGIVVGIMAALNKGRKGTTKHTYLDANSFNVFNRYDHHINTQQTFVIIKKDPPSSGGSGIGRSSVHRSSSGRSHGGGGRKF